MKIVLIGATGYVGSAILKEALDRGHHVTAVARHPEKLSSTRISILERLISIRRTRWPGWWRVTTP